MASSRRTSTEVRDALILDARPGDGSVLSRSLGDGFSLPALLGEVSRHYLERALAEADGNRSRAAALLGLGSHQTLTNWLARHGLRRARKS